MSYRDTGHPIVLEGHTGWHIRRLRHPAVAVSEHVDEEGVDVGRPGSVDLCETGSEDGLGGALRRHTPAEVDVHQCESAVGAVLS